MPKTIQSETVFGPLRRPRGFDPVPAFNPYWDRAGLTFEDPDGYRTVLQHAAWTR